MDEARTCAKCGEHPAGATVGGLAAHLTRLRQVSSVGDNIFNSLGLAYLGPVDGHDIPSIEAALCAASGLRRPVVVHVITVKGKGHAPAERDDEDCLHAVGVVDPATGKPVQAGRPTWPHAFADEIVAIGAERDDVVCVTAAMLHPTGLARFAERFPGRIFDVGIAEQHAVTSAAGLALGGLHPVVAIYSTFLSRAFDQVLMDVALHRLPVTLVLDRAGVTGPDGPSHHGMWDASILPVIPGLRLACPRDLPSLGVMLREAVRTDGPTAIRHPKAAAGPEIPAMCRVGGCDILRADPDPQVLLVPVGPLAQPCLGRGRRTRRGPRHTGHRRRPPLDRAARPRAHLPGRTTPAHRHHRGHHCRGRAGRTARPGAGRDRADCPRGHHRAAQPIPATRVADRDPARTRPGCGWHRHRRPRTARP